MKKNIRYKPSRINSGITFAVGILFIFLGVTAVIPTTIMSGFFPAIIFSFVWTGGAIAITVGHGLYLFGKKNKTDFFGGFEITDEEPRQKPTAAFRPDAPDHMHITGVGLSSKERLEQLESLRAAGLLTEEEYARKRKEIVEGL